MYRADYSSGEVYRDFKRPKSLYLRKKILPENNGLKGSSEIRCSGYGATRPAKVNGLSQHTRKTSNISSRHGGGGARVGQLQPRDDCFRQPGWTVKLLGNANYSSPSRHIEKQPAPPSSSSTDVWAQSRLVRETTSHAHDSLDLTFVDAILLGSVRTETEPSIVERYASWKAERHAFEACSATG